MPDKLIMPFGKYKGTDIEDVDDSYLYWLSCQDWISQWPAIHAYLKKNKQGIEKNAGIDSLREEIE